ncbi:hypothetical protein [Pedobacter sp. Leaf194]|uniref:hypothetical protein n=1 Tax=Pedobacter sp. Leaf194 TaxID=1736297 RepID=UPI000A9FB84D|nr:hypothetical protein [Pedobacter sp. Leaf194]
MKMGTPLTIFLCKAAEDQVISPTHISLFTSIVQCWASGGRMNPVVVTRKKLMRISKIRSTSTYHKCITDLSRSGYITYLPSFNPSGSLILLNK